MTRNSNDAAGQAADIPDLSELADRIDVVLAYPWIDRAGFLRDAMQGLKRAAQVLPAVPLLGQLLAGTRGASEPVRSRLAPKIDISRSA